jgi:RNA-directed DNA polymerase
MSSFVKSLDELAMHIGMPTLDLFRLVRSCPDHYKTFCLQKKSGGFRVINAPSQTLKTIQKWISTKLLPPDMVHDSATGYRSGYSIVDNAKAHTGKEWVYNLDIEKFFPSIKAGRVEQLWLSLGFTRRMAAELTQLTTLHGELPQGAPSSPALANLICLHLDQRLSSLAASRGWTYTRYCDDLTFSGSGRIAGHDERLVARIINEEGFAVNLDKVRIIRRNSRQTVTGLVVNSFPNVQRKTRRRVRAMEHQFKQNLERDSEMEALEVGATAAVAAGTMPCNAHQVVDYARLQGYIAYIRMVRQAL